MDLFYDGWIRPFFDRAESIPGMTPLDISVYVALLTIARAAGGESREFSCAIRTIESKSRVKRTSIYASVNRLKQFGLLETKPSGGRASAKYRLRSLHEHNPGHNTEHNPGHNPGLLDDTKDDDDIYTSRAREAFGIWRDAFGEQPVGEMAEQVAYWAYHWDAALLREAFSAAALAGAKNRAGYVGATLRSWREQGITTIEQWAHAQAVYDDMIKQ